MLYLALGEGRDTILARINRGSESLIIIDTLRSLLQLQDENDNAEIGRVCTPFVEACASLGKTLILSHHLRKETAEHGKGITGGHAFLAVVDRALELCFSDVETRREVRGQGRVEPVPSLLYEMQSDGKFLALGNPHEVALREVEECIIEALSSEWISVGEIRDSLSEPRPSDEQIRLALGDVLRQGRVERDPPQGGRGRKRLFRRVEDTSDPGAIPLLTPGG